MTALGQEVSDALAPRAKIRVPGRPILIDILLDLAGDGGMTDEQRRIDAELAVGFVAGDVAAAEIVGALRLMQRSWFVRLIDAAAAIDEHAIPA